MTKTEAMTVITGLIIAATTTFPGAFVLAGVLIGGAFTSSAQRALREDKEQMDTQLAEWNARCDEREMK